MERGNILLVIAPAALCAVTPTTALAATCQELESAERALTEAWSARNAYNEGFYEAQINSERRNCDDAATGDPPGQDYCQQQYEEAMENLEQDVTLLEQAVAQAEETIRDLSSQLNAAGISCPG